MITVLIFTPLIGALLGAAARADMARRIGLLFAAGSALPLMLVWMHFDPASAAIQLVERHAWIPAIGAEYLVGADGISMLFLVLTTFVVAFGILAGPAEKRFYPLMLVLQSALYGTFAAQNFVLWFLFYEMSLVPAFLLIRNMDDEASGRAATKFFVMTFLGSAAMLLGFLAIYQHTGTFDLPHLAEFGPSGVVLPQLAWPVFICVCLGLAVKAPLFPLHTWLPDAYATAPTGVTMVLTGVMSKMGVYGFIRLVLPLFPHQLHDAGRVLLPLTVCSIVFPALAAWAQRDLKRMAAYLSINHLGYCMLGLFAVAAGTDVAPADVKAALGGVLMQVFNHGVTAAALFYFVGLLSARTGTRDLAGYGGLMQKAPVFCALMSVAIFSSMGLPGLNGFIGEFLIFKGAFGSATFVSGVACLGLLFTAVALLGAMKALFSGPFNEKLGDFAELTVGELAVIVPVSALMVAAGIAPGFVFEVFNASVTSLSHMFQ